MFSLQTAKMRPYFLAGGGSGNRLLAGHGEFSSKLSLNKSKTVY
jgi:hypothetical protein